MSTFRLVFLCLCLPVFFPVLLCAQNYAEVLSSGTKHADAGVTVNVDAEGNMYTLGLFSDTSIEVKVGTCSKTVTSRGGKDYFLAKYSKDMVLLWVVRIGGSTDEGGGDNWSDLVFDVNRTVYLTGTFTGTCYFESVSAAPFSLLSAGEEDVFVAAYSPEGNLSWLRRAGGPLRDEAEDICTDHVSQLYVCGRFSDTADFGTFQVKSKGGMDAFVANYTMSGVCTKVTSGGGTDEDLAYHLELDKAGDVLVAGGLCCNNSSAQYGTFNISNSGGWGTYAGKLNHSSFTWEWMSWLGGAQGDASNPPLCDDSNNVYVMYVSGSDTPVMSSAGPPVSFAHDSTDLLLVKLNSSGVIKWVHRIPGSGNEDCFSAYQDGAGHFYFSGYFSGSMLLGNNQQTLQSRGGFDEYILEYDQQGNFLWAISGGGKGADVGTRVAADKNGTIYFTGSFEDTAYYGTQQVISKGESDYVLGKLSVPKPYKVNMSRTFICADDSVLLTGDTLFEGRSLVWLTKNILIPGANGSSYYATDSGYYRVVATNVCGARDSSEEVYLAEKIVPVPVVAFADTVICAGDSVELLLAGYDTAYTCWWNNIHVTDSLWVKPATDEVFYVKYTDGICYSEADSVKLEVEPLPVAGFSLHPSLGYAPLLVAMKNTSQNYTKLSWRLGEQGDLVSHAADTNYLYEDTGTFAVKLVAENKAGCLDSVTDFVTVYDSVYLFIPNAFSPNGDGKNDVWQFTLYGIKEYELLLFDRWGEKIFTQDEKKGFTVSWDGNYRGVLLPDGIYFYLLQYTGQKRGSRGNVNGIVNLMK